MSPWERKTDQLHVKCDRCRRTTSADSTFRDGKDKICPRCYKSDTIEHRKEILNEFPPHGIVLNRNILPRPRSMRCTRTTT